VIIFSPTFIRSNEWGAEAVVIAQVGSGRYRSRFSIRRPTCRTLPYVSLLPYDETAVRRQTKTEPAIATGLKFEDTQLVTTKKFLPWVKFV
jgi:hypothetical protein